MRSYKEVPTLLKKLITPKGRREVKRSRQSYLQEQGWKRVGAGADARWDGWYRTRFGSYRGSIRLGSPPQFFIYKPPAELRRHSHWCCFSDRGSGWYSVHFSRVPRELDSGILRIERVIHESFCLPQPKSA